ncbi:MAG: chemotaxis protein CheW [Pseudomonadota bacterium]
MTEAAAPALRELADQPFELLREMERRATARYASDADTTAWVGVGLRVGSHRYVVAREAIREVMKRPDLTRVPGAQSWLRGLANVRGQLLPVVDLHMLVDGGPTSSDRRTRVVIANNDDVPMAVLASEVFGFRRFADQDRVGAEDASGDLALAEFVDGAFRRDGATWPVLSFDRVINSPRLLSAV